MRTLSHVLVVVTACSHAAPTAAPAPTVVSAPAAAAAPAASTSPAPEPEQPIEGDNESARAHYHRAKLLFDEGMYREASDEFIQSYQAAPHPEMLYNVAKCFEKLEDLERARLYYKRYLAQKPNATNRKVVEEKLEAIKRELDLRGR